MHKNTASASTEIIQPHWRQWWEEMISDIEGDHLVKSEIRRTIRSKIYPNFMSIGLNQLKSAMVASDQNKAMQIIDSLNNFGYVFSSQLLRFIFRIIGRVSFFRYLLDINLKIRCY